MNNKNAANNRKRRIYLEGMAFQIYIYMINHKLDIDENPFLTKKGDLLYHIGKLVKEDLIKKNGEGIYVIREEHVLNTLLRQFLHQSYGPMRRYIFYFAFMISTLAIFVIYLLFLPRTSFTTEIYILGFAMFSFAALTLEAVMTRSRLKMLERLIQ